MKRFFPLVTLGGLLAVLAAGYVYFDEGVYVAMSHWMLSGGSAGFFESIRPLGLPFLLIPAMLFGEPLIAGRVFMVLVTLGLIPAVYWACKPLGKDQAWAAAFLFAMSYAVVFYGGYILTDILAYTSILIAAGFAFRDKPFLAGLVVGLGFLVKFPVALFGLPLIILFWKRPHYVLAGAAVGAAPYVLFNLLYYDGNFIHRVLDPMLSGSAIVGHQTWLYPAANIWSHVEFLKRDFPIMLLAAYALTWTYKEKSTRLLIGGWLLYLLYFSFRIARFDPRYTTSLVLLLVPLAAIGFVVLAKKLKRYAPVLYIVCMIPMFLAISYTYEHQSPTHDASIKNTISGTVVTNNGILLLYADSGLLVPSPNLGYTFTKFFESDAPVFAMDIDAYPCPPGDNHCQSTYDARLAYIIDNNPILACGRVHGVRTIVIARGGESISDCAQRLGLTLPPPPSPERFLRLHGVSITPEGSLAHENALTALINKNLTTYVMFTPTNNALGEESKRILQAPNVRVGVLGQDQAFNNRMREQGLPITVVSPETDDWYSSTPTGDYDECIVGSWDQSITPWPCRHIDIYTFDWETNNFRNVQKQYEALRRGDPVIGINIPGDKLTEIFENQDVLRLLDE